MSDLNSETPALTADHLPEPKIERIRNAIIAPVGREGRLPHGVFRANGTFCDHTRTLLSQSRLTDIPDCPKKTGLKLLKGRFLYGGLARDHFGHFLLESLSRLWAIPHVTDPVEAVLFSPRRGAPMMAPLLPEYQPLFQMLSGDVPSALLTEPVLVEELLVPSPGFGHQSWIAGTSQFRAVVRPRLEAACAAEGPVKLYISRRQLDGDDKHVDQEDRIEEMMQTAGYSVFHPQAHSIETQIAHYRAARFIVGPDGSAFHLAAFVSQPVAQVGLIKRRHRDAVVRSFAHQFAAFGGSECHLINALLPQTDTLDINTARLDFDQLKDAMHQVGLL